MAFDDIPAMPYMPKGEPASPEVRERYWKTAIGLQQADGLEVSSFLQEVAEANVRGTCTLIQTYEQLHEYYGLANHRPPNAAETSVSNTRGSDASLAPVNRTMEADLVSQRIVELLANGGFMLDPAMLTHIHRTLFQDLDPAFYRPGTYKTEQLIKPEAVLNGDSVFYAPPSMYAGMFNALFGREALYTYAYPLGASDVANLARFVAHIWQVHPFYEGNTRTVAVFAELYLRDLGCDITNDPFERHTAYFRDALVRANYRNRAVGVDYDCSFVEKFFAYLVDGVHADDAERVLDRAELVCQPLFDHPEALKYATEQDAAPVRAYLAQLCAGEA